MIDTRPIQFALLFIIFALLGWFGFIEAMRAFAERLPV